MQADLHYYVTFIAARAAGWSHEDAAEIALAAHYVDCSGDPDTLHAPWKAGETLQKTITCVAQLMKAKENSVTMPAANQLIWSAFHFLPALDADPEARYDYAYDDRRWAAMAGDGVRRRVPNAQNKKLWVYAQAKEETGHFATSRAYKLAMRSFPNSRTIAAMTLDTIAQLDTLAVLRTAKCVEATAPAKGDGGRYAARAEARKLREQALALIGVRLHVLADSFSHAGFAGMTSSINKEDGAWLLVDPTKIDQKEVEINFALGSHGVVKWLAVGHATAGALPDMPGGRYSYKNPKLDIRIFKDNPITYKYAVMAVQGFLADMRPHVPARLATLEEPGAPAVPDAPLSAAAAAVNQRFVALLASIVGGDAGPMFLTDEDFQYPHPSNRKTGYAFRHVTSWAWGSNMWEYNKESPDVSLELRCKKLLAKIREIVPAPAPAARKWHDICDLRKIPEGEDAAFQKIEDKLGLGSTYIEEKGTEYSIIRRVRVKYFEQSEEVPKFSRLRAADWAAQHHITWFDATYGAAIRREMLKEQLDGLAGQAE